MRTRLFLVIVATSVLVGAGTPGAQQLPGSGACFTDSDPPLPSSCTLTLIDVPGATGPQGTSAQGINDRSQIVGSFTDAAQKLHGFLRTNGQFIPIDVPNADRTEAWGINNRTQIVGSYVVNGQSHSFLLADGRFTTLDPPGATSASAYGINDLGQIVGTYTDGAGSYGYLWTHGRFNVIGDRSAPALQMARGINRIGQVVGGNSRLGADGSVATSWTDLPFGVAFFSSGINDRGEIVAWNDVVLDGVHAFLLAFGKSFFLENVLREFVPVSNASVAYGINNRGQIVGVLRTISGERHGFLLTPPNVVEDVSASASPDGSRAPIVTVIVDNALDTWTLGPGEEILRNGVQAAGGYGSQILLHGGAIYVLGDDYNWWRWTGSTWSFAGAIDPAS